MIDKWDNRFIELCQVVASWSKDNGFPRGVKDCSIKLADKATKYNMVVHAEANAILNAHKDVRGDTIYVWPLPPCNECAKLIIQAGIKEVKYGVIKVSQQWEYAFKISEEMFKEAGIKTTYLGII